MGPAAGSNRMELTLLEELASGTFARVYLAEAKGQGGVDRLVAVKVLREKWADSEEVLTRTRDEARLLARLRHKHIVRVEELSEFDDQPAIIMEYVEGLNLQQLLDLLKGAHQRFPARAALQIGVATASALDAAFRRVPYGQQDPLQVIHRDVKPSNVMLSIDGELKVLDFGTARASSPLRSAQTGMMRFGSWKYMSPERKEGDRGDHASDIYSLGLLLIELLGNDWIQGLPVSPGEHDNQLRRLVEGLDRTGMPNEAWDRALKDLLLQMSAFNPEVRPSAQQLVDVLRQYADQAEGQNMDALATEVVAQELRGGGQNSAEGALTGTRLFVSLDGSEPPTARRADEPAQPAPYGAPQPAPAVDDFDEPATVVQPYASPGHYAVASPGGAQVRFAGDGQPAQVDPEHTEPNPAEAPAFGAPVADEWSPQPAAPAPAPQPAAPAPAPQPAAAQPWQAAPQAFQPAPLSEQPHVFAVAGSDPAETEYLPPPDAGMPSGPIAQGPVVHAPIAGPVAHAPASGPIAAGPVAPAPTPRPAPPKKSKLPLILGVLVALFLLCAGLPAVAWIAYNLLGVSPGEFQAPELPVPDVEQPEPDDPGEEPDEDPGEEPIDDPVQPPADQADAVPVEPDNGEVAVSIRAADRLIRRLELTTAEGAPLEGSKGSIDAQHPPGDYILTIKVAGRDPVSADLRVGDIGVNLLCAPDDKMVKVLCKNPDGDIALVLK
jgi:serine/threonine protein kinase